MNACVNLPMSVLTLLHYFSRGLKSLSLPHRLLHGGQLAIQKAKAAKAKVNQRASHPKVARANKHGLQNTKLETNGAPFA